MLECKIKITRKSARRPILSHRFSSTNEYALVSFHSIQPLIIVCTIAFHFHRIKAMSSSSRNSALILGGILVAAGMFAYLQMRPSDIDHDSKKDVEDETDIPAHEKEEEKVKAAEAITRSYSLTEIAANNDPTIAEQNRKIAEQKMEFETSQKVEAEEKSKAEALVSSAYRLTEEKAMKDPAVAAENKKIAEQKKLLLEKNDNNNNDDARDDDDETQSNDAGKKTTSNNKNRRRNRNKKKNVTSPIKNNKTNGVTPSTPPTVAAVLKSKNKTGKKSAKKGNNTAAAAAVKEIQSFQASAKKKKKNKNHQ